MGNEEQARKQDSASEIAQLTARVQQLEQTVSKLHEFYTYFNSASLRRVYQWGHEMEGASDGADAAPAS